MTSSHMPAKQAQLVCGIKKKRQVYSSYTHMLAGHYAVTQIRSASADQHQVISAQAPHIEEIMS